MGKSTHFFGQPVYGQLIKSLDHDKIVEINQKNGDERYVKSWRIGHFAWYSNHTMSQWVKLRGEFAAYSFVSQQMALYLCIAV